MLPRLPREEIRAVFIAVIVVLGVQMILRGLGIA
jgi:uncharacterized membrane protein YfcA